MDHSARSGLDAHLQKTHNENQLDSPPSEVKIPPISASLKDILKPEHFKSAATLTMDTQAQTNEESK